ncbi:hypothetical protein CC86DRAFT_378915 [Ophiobolus disseminans]|uniref:DUF3176 domain containing protein n=1 Tax=Ophiobolus disseminans TaxID=1469910 RepID=A0A6A7ABM9_9PLEO|nr:hypothetical protein CC86DRAFT_378915 [Ophiobolus disseminans]
MQTPGRPLVASRQTFSRTLSGLDEHCDVPPPSYRASVRERFSLDIPRRIERKLAQYNASKSIFKRWLFEIVSVIISALCMALLQNRPLGKWSFGLTIITVLSKIASAALILPISEAIGQLKWSWFHGKESKDALDFEIFDKASRGVWGSILLLFRTKGKSLAALGAMITVLLLGIDTFFQQVTDLPERWTVRGEGSISRTIQYQPASVYTFQSDMGDSPMTTAGPDVRGALSPYFYDQNGTQYTAGGNNTQAGFPLSCPTSQCEWSPYQLLSVCSACVDVSSLLTYACLPMKMDWIRSSMGPGTENTYPNGTACGYFLNATSVAPVLMSGYRVVDNGSSEIGETLLMRTLPLVTNPRREGLYGGSINFKHLNGPILDALIVSAADGSAESVYRKELPVAQECMLSWCVKTLRSSYSWGTYKEVVEDTVFNTSKTEFRWLAIDHPNHKSTYMEYAGNISIYPPNASRDGPGYGLSNNTQIETVVALDEIFPSMITIANAAAKPFMKVKTSFRDKVVFRPVTFSPWLAPNNVTNHMERLAMALANLVRSDPNSNELVIGQAFAPETYVKVHWGWLTFPLAMLILCIVFLVATIIKTSNDATGDFGTWKTSAMPALIYSLPQDVRNNLTKTLTSRSTTGGDAKKVKIRLLPDQGWRVSGQMITSPTLSRRNNTQPPPGWV